MGESRRRRRTRRRSRTPTERRRVALVLGEMEEEEEEEQDSRGSHARVWRDSSETPARLRQEEDRAQSGVGRSAKP